MSLRVHGMDGAMAEPVWPPLTDPEVREILSRYPLAAAKAEIVWSSPRPMSAAAVVVASGRRVFVKRHSPRVRTAGHLETEHAFGDWLRARGVPVPEVLATTTGARVVAADGGIYEVHEIMPGTDRYRDAMSWTPYADAGDARAAGRALARLHGTSAGFDRPAHPPGILVDSVAMVTAGDPLAAVIAHIAARPVILRFLGGRDWRAEIADALAGPLRRAVEAGLAAAAPLWTHGDWHPSNLSWEGHEVVGVFDLGLANRTFAMHDLAVAVERACFDWLGEEVAVDRTGWENLVEGYHAVRPLSPVDRRHLSAALPVAHVEYALSEIEYFAGPASSSADAELAYENFLLGHGRWFDHVGRIGHWMT